MRVVIAVEQDDLSVEGLKAAIDRFEALAAAAKLDPATSTVAHTGEAMVLQVESREAVG